MPNCGSARCATAFRIVGAAAVVSLLAAGAFAQTSNPAELYKQALAREALLRKELDRPSPPQEPLLGRIRIMVGAYSDIARLFPASDYGDDALWQGAMLAADAYRVFALAEDRENAVRLLTDLGDRFPDSALTAKAGAEIRRLGQAAPADATTSPVRTPAASTPAPAAPAAPAPVPTPPASSPAAATSAVASRANESPAQPAPADPPASASPAPPASRAGSAGPVTLRAVRHERLASTLRFTLDLDREVSFRDERLDGPPRVFVDLLETRAADALGDATLAIGDALVKQVRIGRQADARIRVVFDLNADTTAYSVYALYDPYRIVIDFEQPRSARPAAPAASRAAATSGAPPAGRTGPAATSGAAPAPVTATGSAASTAAAAPATAPATTATRPAAAKPSTSEAALRPAAPPAAPAAPAPRRADVPREAAFVTPPLDPTVSLSRQLGLSAARIVIDPGHGGHDPGAQAKGLEEASLVLDIALRLEKLLVEQEGMDVVLTRRTDVFVPLEMRTEIANKSGADLFLSVHVNANESGSARGIETYFLNFAQDQASEALAARENAGSSRGMRHLPDIVEAIALNNKIDESREFATIVHSTLYERLRTANKDLKNLGVKQAPFMVLVGAGMPAILAEISFMTNTTEAALLKTDKYRQQIAEALLAGIVRYQKALKAPPVATAR